MCEGGSGLGWESRDHHLLYVPYTYRVAKIIYNPTNAETRMLHVLHVSQRLYDIAMEMATATF